MAELLLIASKLINFTWNTRKLNNSQMINTTKISQWWAT